MRNCRFLFNFMSSFSRKNVYGGEFLLKRYRIVFSYHQVQEHPKLFLAMTGLTQAEFDPLLQHFQCAWDQYVQQNYVDRDDRQRQYGGGRSELTLVNIEDKLLFILYYVKVYPLQEILAFEFGMVQSTANEWIHLLSEVLKKALDHGGYVPEGRISHLGEASIAAQMRYSFGTPLIRSKRRHLRNAMPSRQH